MNISRPKLVAWMSAALSALIQAQTPMRVIDVPTRPGVTQRLLVLTPDQPKAVVLLFAGGHGGLQIALDGTLGWGRNNFLVRSRERFAAQGFMVAVIDAPSDMQRAPFLQGQRQRREHVADVRAAMTWLRAETKLPIWLIGTSRGTQSVAYLATELTDAERPDGIVLTASVVQDKRGRPVPAMPLHKVTVPVLVAHHERDDCVACPYADVVPMMKQFTNAPRQKLLTFTGGVSEGDPCEALAHHGFNGIENEVVRQIAAWISTK